MKTGLGLLAGLLTTVAWIPQIVHSFQRRSVVGISWGYLATIGTGVLLWLLYGIWTRSLPLIAADAVSDALVLLLAGMKAGRFGCDAAPTADHTVLPHPEKEAVRE